MAFPESDSDANDAGAGAGSGGYSGPGFSSSSSSSSLSDQQPISMVMTEFHFLLLYRDRLVAMSRLTGHLVQEQFLSGRGAGDLGLLSGRGGGGGGGGSLEQGGRLPLSLLRDGGSRTLWMITTSAAYQVRV